MENLKNEQLLELFLAASHLKTLHSKGGLELSKQHAQEKQDEYRQEILRRMSHGKEINQTQD
jgi:hypothetical protein